MRLAARGHRVDLLTGQPGGVASRAEVDGIRVRYVRTPLPGPLARRGVTREGAFGAVAAAGAAASQADVVVSYLYADAYGASLVRRRRPLVLKLTGAVPLRWLEERGQRLEHALLRRALDAADEVWVNSRYVVEAMADWDRPMSVVPAGIDTSLFTRVRSRDDEPLVVSAAAPEEPRKRVEDLLDAWAGIRDGLPGARLLLAGAVTDTARERLLARVPQAHRSSVRFAGRLDDAALVDAYSRAWVTVAPAVHEALGLVTVESLACGTPVAGADSGATTELLSQPGTGVLFRPVDPASLAEAVVSAATLAQEPGCEDRCRRSALRYAWPDIIDGMERRLGALIG